ncbi:MAG: MOSC domain-containing protein [Candidatus Nanoarchaeia archaeon]
MKFEKTTLSGKVNRLYMSIYPDIAYDDPDYFVTQSVDELECTPEGIMGDRHFGFVTASGGRVTDLYDKGTPMKNNRQWLALSYEEVVEIADNLGIEGKLTPELLGANLLIEGLGKMSNLPSMTYLVISPDENYKSTKQDNVVLVVYGQALPCKIAGKALVEPCGDSSLEKKFPKGAMELRGATGWIEKGGVIRPDYIVHALTPKGID